MTVETIRIPTSRLVLGMYVVKLDRPWSQTPFRLHGFRISSSDELALFNKYARFAFVDIERGVTPPLDSGDRYVFDDKGRLLASSGFTQFEYSHRVDLEQKVRDIAASELPGPRIRYEIKTAFSQVLPDSLAAIEQTKQSLQRLMLASAAELGRLMPALRDSARRLETSVLDNPDPAVLIRTLSGDQPFSYRHAVHSAILAIAMGRELGFQRQRIHELTMGVLLADIGKRQLPKELLRTTRRLDARETKRIQEHVNLGVALAEKLDGLSVASIEIIASHHERFNGEGYPAALRGGQIPLLARIAGLVDSFDAITSERTYCGPVPLGEAVQEIFAATEQQFQPELVDVLLGILGTYPIGAMVRCSDGAIALVVDRNRAKPLCPQLLMLTDAKLNELEHPALRVAGGPDGVAVTGLMLPEDLSITTPDLDVLDCLQ